MSTDRIVRTGERVGRYHVYRWNDLRWWRVPDSSHFDQWYVYVVDVDGEQVGDGEYSGANPSSDPQQVRAWFRAEEGAA